MPYCCMVLALLENWNKLSKALTKHHKVYAIDLPSFGETEAIY